MTNGDTPLMRSLQSLTGELEERIGDIEMTGLLANPGVPVGPLTLYCTVIAYGLVVLVATTIAEEFQPTPPVMPVMTTGQPRTVAVLGAVETVNCIVAPELTIRAVGVSETGVAVL